jgi:hypothetical protein
LESSPSLRDLSARDIFSKCFVFYSKPLNQSPEVFSNWAFCMITSSSRGSFGFD